MHAALDSEKDGAGSGYYHYHHGKYATEGYAAGKEQKQFLEYAEDSAEILSGAAESVIEIYHPQHRSPFLRPF